MLLESYWLMQYVHVKNAKNLKYQEQRGKNHFNADSEWNLNVCSKPPMGKVGDVCCGVCTRRFVDHLLSQENIENSPRIELVLRRYCKVYFLLYVNVLNFHPDIISMIFSDAGSVIDT